MPTKAVAIHPVTLASPDQLDNRSGHEAGVKTDFGDIDGEVVEYCLKREYPPSKLRATTLYMYILA